MKEILELAKDEKWLHRMTIAIYQHWHKRNVRQKELTEKQNDLLSPVNE